MTAVTFALVLAPLVALDGAPATPEVHFDIGGGQVHGVPLVFIDDPIALDGAPIDKAAYERVVSRVGAAQTASAAHVHVVVGRAELFAARDARPAPPSAKAAALLKQGEDLLLTFEYARAAAALGECAAVVESDPQPADAEVLSRARLLEAEAWVEAKNDAAAKDALRALLLVRPEIAPDPTLLSPAARALFADALAEARASGSGTLEVKSDPAGADVVVDGVMRGQAPLALAGVPTGVHRVRVHAPGYDDARAEIAVQSNARALDDAKLVATPLRRVLEDVTHAAASHADAHALLEDVRAAASDAFIARVVLIGMSGGTTITRTISVTEPPSLGSNPPGVVDDGSLFGAPLPPKLATSAAPATPSSGDDDGVLVWGGVAIGAAVVVGAVAAGTFLLWPKPQPEPRLGVVLSL